MSAQTDTTPVVVKKDWKKSGAVRIAKYSALRLISLFITVCIGIYITIMIVNMGGYVDELKKGMIRDETILKLSQTQAYKDMEPTERADYVKREITLEEKRLGLDRPFIIRSFEFLVDAITLNLGNAENMTSDSGSRSVDLIILERLPYTLLLMGTSNLLIFFITIAIALRLSRKYGSFWDKFFIAASPLSAMPSWFYGIFMILIFAALLHWLPFGGIIGSPAPTTPWEKAVDIAEHMILPTLSLFIAQFFVSVYSWRTFFMIYSSEDYVEMAKAKGLTEKMIQRRYLLRPTLPNIITSFSLMIIRMWTGAIVTEKVFNWSGIGSIINQAANAKDTAVILGTTVIYAYLLAITVFMLDFIYAAVDPRVSVGGKQS